MAMATQNETISLETLIRHHNIGFKVVPLAEDAKTPTVRSTNEIYDNPGYWSSERLASEHYLFKNVATTFGKTHIKDEKGRELYLNELDIDSKEVFDRLAIIHVKDKDYFFIDEMRKRTFVVKTRKTFGYRVYWLSHEQYPPIRTPDCKYRHEFEIKTDNSSGHGTLPESRHRDDPNFHYQSIGQETIAIMDDEYNGILKVLNDCLKTKYVQKKRNSESYDSTTNLNDNRLHAISEKDIEEIVFQISDSYGKNCRNDIVYGLSALLFKNNMSLDSAEKIISGLCTITNDEEKNSRIKVLYNTYTKGQNHEQISGYSSLLNALKRNTDGETAVRILQNILQILKRYTLPILEQLQDHVVKELSYHTFEIICYSPIKFIIAHSSKKQILDAQINDKLIGPYENKDGQQMEEMQNIQFRTVIINAIPIRLTRYENLSSVEIKYEIEFETPIGEVFRIEPKTIEEILTELKVKGLIYKIRSAEEALPAILNAYYREGKMTIKRELETPGFYLVDGKIVGFQAEHNEPDKQQIIKCADILNRLLSLYKRQDIIATFIKWGIVSPFSFVIKQLEEEHWMQWPYAYGWTNTGKTTLGKIVLAFWRKHKDKKKHDIGFSNADNVARFGRAISYDTYPVLINEVQLNDERQQKQLVEALKHAVQSQTARARLATRSTAEYISALGPCILTSNSSPPADPAILRRIISIYFSKEDEPTEEERVKFNTFLNSNVDTLGVLGDYAANYLLKNQDLVHKDWRFIAETILTSFFKEADKEAPEWIGYFVEQTQVQDAAEEQEQLVKGFLIKTINETFSRNYRTFTPKEEVEKEQAINSNGFEHRLIFCCNKELIPFLRKKDDCTILILQNIIKEMKDQRLNHMVSLAELARTLQCAIKPTKIDGKTCRLISIPIKKLIDFALPTL
jgi:hypothetical protein